jgi:Trk K+ transport system NAD-binding subunit
VDDPGVGEQAAGRQPIDNYVVCGGNALAHRLVVELTEHYALPVVAIVPSSEGDHAPQIIKILGDDAVIVAPAITEEVLRAAGIATARGLALVEGEDHSKLQVALRAQSINPDIRIVLRIYNYRLGVQVQQLLKNCAALSGSATAAPAFANAALNRPQSVRVGGRDVCIALDEEINPGTYLCTVAEGIDVRDIADLDLLPGEAVRPSRSWIDLAEGRRAEAESRPAGRAILRFLDDDIEAPISRVAKLRWRLVDLRRYFTRGGLRLVLFSALTAVLVSFAAIWYLGRPFGWAVYAALLDMAGAAQPDAYGQFSGTGGVWQRMAQVVLTFTGITLIPVVTAITLDFLASGRRSGPKEPSAGIRGHMIVVGLGNMGTRVATLLNEYKVPTVCIERQESRHSRGIAVAKSLDLPVILGEAPLEDQLHRAGVRNCRAVIAVSSDDAANLEAVFEARAIRPDVRVVLRLFDDEFAAQFYANFSNAASRSASYLSAPAFAAALMDRDVVGTLPLYRRVILLAEHNIEPGSRYIDQSLAEMEAPGQLRVLALRRGTETAFHWRPDPVWRLNSGDRIVVAATRIGFGRLHHPASS